MGTHGAREGVLVQNRGLKHLGQTCAGWREEQPGKWLRSYRKHLLLRRNLEAESTVSLGEDGRAELCVSRNGGIEPAQNAGAKGRSGEDWGHGCGNRV